MRHVVPCWSVRMAWCPTSEPFGRPFAIPYTRARWATAAAPWRNVLIAQVVKRYERRRVVETDRRIVDGTPTRVETLRQRSQGNGVINTAYIERLNATFRERLRRWHVGAGRWHARP